MQPYESLSSGPQLGSILPTLPPLLETLDGGEKAFFVVTT